MTINSYKRKCLFTIKGVKIFPLVSVFYALLGLFVVLPLLFFIAERVVLTDNGSQISAWYGENAKLDRMNAEKIQTGELKNNEYPLIKIKGTDIDTDAKVKILVLGDSFVWPYSSSNMNYIWWNRLSNELKQRGYDCVVYGVGRPGASTEDQVQWLKKTSLLEDLEPDLVLIGYVQNDTELSSAVAPEEKHYGLLSYALDSPLLNGIKKVFPGVFMMFDMKLSVILGPTEILSNKIGYQEFTYELRNIDEVRLPLYNEHAVVPLGEISAATNIPFILVTTPQSPNIVYFEPRYAPVLPLFEQAGITTYNLLYDFYDRCSEEVYKKNYHINPADDHPGTATTWFYANYLADKLERDFPDVLGEKAKPGTRTFDIEINDWMPYAIKPQPIFTGSMNAEYRVTYPRKSDADAFLTLPINREFIRLNFRYPVEISSITIEGQNLNAATVYVTAVNEDLGFDDQTAYPLGTQSGRVCNWSGFDSRRVTSLFLSAEIAAGASDTLTLKITGKEGGVSP